MKNYRMEVFPSIAEDGTVYWTAKFPDISGCVGGGASAEEAMSAAKENLDIYLEYLDEEGISAPDEVFEQDYSGKIALRLAKSTHKKVAEMAKADGVSINSFINSAIENFTGIKQYEFGLDKKVEDVRKITMMSFEVQQITAATNAKIWDKINSDDQKVGVFYGAY